MSDIHVLAGNGRGKVSVVMHCAVPDTNNSAAGGGVNWRTALVASGIGGSTQLADAVDDENPLGWEITAAEKAQVESGELFERRRDFPLESAGTEAAGQRVALRAFYAREKAAVIANLQERLKYTGHVESES